MLLKDFKANSLYRTKPVKHLFESYILKLGISSGEFWGSFDQEKINHVLFLASSDFVEGKISMDDISSIANHLYYNGKVWGPFEFTSKGGGTNLGDMLDKISELAYYNWQKSASGNHERVEEILEIIRKFYNHKQNNS